MTRLKMVLAAAAVSLGGAPLHAQVTFGHFDQLASAQVTGSDTQQNEMMFTAQPGSSVASSASALFTTAGAHDTASASITSTFVDPTHIVTSFADAVDASGAQAEYQFGTALSQWDYIFTAPNPFRIGFSSRLVFSEPDFVRINPIDFVLNDSEDHGFYGVDLRYNPSGVSDNIAAGTYRLHFFNQDSAAPTYIGALPAQNASGSVDIRFLDASAVPEPASWALMIGGFGLVGGAMRRRRRTALA